MSRLSAIQPETATGKAKATPGRSPGQTQDHAKYDTGDGKLPRRIGSIPFIQWSTCRRSFACQTA